MAQARLVTLTADMRAVIEVSQLCFAATVTPEGRPSLSPKGTIRVWDDEHLFFLDIASPGTRTNLAYSPWLELNVVDQLSRRGYRFAGRTTLHEPGSTVYADGREPRARWRERRVALDREFEVYLAQIGPTSITESGD